MATKKQEYLQALEKLNNIPIMELLFNYGFYRQLLTIPDTLNTLDMNKEEIKKLVAVRLKEYYNI